MTLITYPTRVHFADDVLEEALYSEMERLGVVRPLLIGPADLPQLDFHERVLAGLPRGADPVLQTFAAGMSYADAMLVVRQRAEMAVPDAIVAYGAARAITLGRKARAALSQLAGRRLPYFVIPNLDGLPDPCQRNLDTWRNSLPNVVICDPTLTVGADPAAGRSAAITSFVRCVESYLASPYNPVADGLALDGLHRCVITLPQLRDTVDANLRREVMAASLNAAMSQEKGLGPTQQIATALAEVRADVDQAAAIRLLLPLTVAERGEGDLRADALCRIIGLERGHLDFRLRDFLAAVPLPQRLSDIGLGRADLDAVAQVAQARFGLRPQVVHALLDRVF